MVDEGKLIEFDEKKCFKYIRPLGSGGTGSTHLFKDELMNIYFTFKRYSPKNIKRLDEYYERFMNEIKILFRISHKNIVRIYNYHLYPENKTGYLQMEYVEGNPINRYYYNGWGKNWNEIFVEIINTFMYLEKHNILHRDIRPKNILIDSAGNVKIIDFGFGKILKEIEDEEKSIALNWPVSKLPSEAVYSGVYNHQTEIYFLGNLFKNLSDKFDGNFRYYHILDKMVQENPFNRYRSFNNIIQDISTGILEEVDFTPQEKRIFQRFSNSLYEKINYFSTDYEVISNIDRIINSLEDLIRNNSLETYIQGNNLLINIFIRGEYNYNNNNDIEIEVVKDFYKLLISSSNIEKRVIIDNIYSKLDTIDFNIKNENILF